jgi:hypothetical protein
MQTTVTGTRLARAALAPGRTPFHVGPGARRPLRVLVSTDDYHVEVWTRDAADVWTSVVSTDGEVADLGSIDARLDVRELYEAAAEGGV